MLKNPDYTRTFQLQTDASDVGVRALLSQGRTEDQWPIAYFSRNLLDHAKRYSTVEKNTALTWLQTFKDKNAVSSDGAWHCNPILSRSNIGKDETMQINSYPMLCTGEGGDECDGPALNSERPHPSWSTGSQAWKKRSRQLANQNQALNDQSDKSFKELIRSVQKPVITSLNRSDRETI